MIRDPGGTWALYVSLLGVILIIPLNILTNIITPKIQNRWAARSRAALRTRIAKLEGELAEMSKTQPISELESFILWRLERVHLTVFFLILLLLETALTGAAAFLPASLMLGNRSWFFIGWIVFAVIMTVGVVMPAMARDKKYRLLRSPFHRERVNKDIQKLTAKLTKPSAT